MRVEVTQDDIDSGLQYDPTHAPLSLALSRALGRPVGTGLRSWFYNTGTTEEVCAYWGLPSEMQEWALRFDMVGRVGVGPRAFDLPLRRITQEEARGLPPKKSGKNPNETPSPG